MLMSSRFCKRQSIRKKNQFLTPIEHWGLWYLFLVRILEVMGERITKRKVCRMWLKPAIVSFFCHILTTQQILSWQSCSLLLRIRALMMINRHFHLLDIHVNEICSLWGILLLKTGQLCYQIGFNNNSCSSFLGQNNNWREILEVKSILFSTYNSFYKSLIKRKWAGAALCWCFTITNSLVTLVDKTFFIPVLYVRSTLARSKNEPLVPSHPVRWPVAWYRLPHHRNQSTLRPQRGLGTSRTCRLW